MALARAAALVLAALVVGTDSKGLLRHDATLDAADAPNKPTCFACPGETRLHRPPTPPPAHGVHDAHDAQALVASKAASAATTPATPPAAPPHLALGDPRRPQPASGSDTLGASEPYVTPTMRKRAAALKALMLKTHKVQKAQQELMQVHAVPLDPEEGSGDPGSVIPAKQKLISAMPALCVGCPDRCVFLAYFARARCKLLQTPHVRPSLFATARDYRQSRVILCPSASPASSVTARRPRRSKLP